jgi:hypothetical protein
MSGGKENNSGGVLSPVLKRESIDSVVCEVEIAPKGIPVNPKRKFDDNGDSHLSDQRAVRQSTIPPEEMRYGGISFSK